MPRAVSRPVSIILPALFVAVFIPTSISTLGWATALVIIIADLLALGWWIGKARFWLAGRRMLPFHLATLAGLHFHIHEELTRGFPAAMRQTFHTPAITDAKFLNIIVFAVPIVYMLAAIGLWFRRPFAEFLSYTVFFWAGVHGMDTLCVSVFSLRPLQLFSRNVDSMDPYGSGNHCLSVELSPDPAR